MDKKPLTITMYINRKQKYMNILGKGGKTANLTPFRQLNLVKNIHKTLHEFNSRNI